MILINWYVLTQTVQLKVEVKKSVSLVSVKQYRGNTTLEIIFRLFKTLMQ